MRPVDVFLVFGLLNARGRTFIILLFVVCLIVFDYNPVFDSQTE